MLCVFSENFNETHLPAKYVSVESTIHKFLDMNQGEVRTQISMVQTEKTPLHYIEELTQIRSGKVDYIRVYQEHSEEGVFDSSDKPERELKLTKRLQYEFLKYGDGNIVRRNHAWDDDAIENALNSTIHNIWHGLNYQDLHRELQALGICDKVCTRYDFWYPLIGIKGMGETIEKEV